MSFQYAYSDFEGHQLKQLNPRIVESLGQQIPKHNASLLIAKTVAQNWHASLIWYYLSDIEWREGDQVRAHDRLDFRLTKIFQFNNKVVKAELIAQNLLGNYPEFKNVNQFKTRLFTRLSLEIP